MVGYERVNIEDYRSISKLALLIANFGYDLECYTNGTLLYLDIRHDNRFDEFEKPLFVKRQNGWTQFYIAYAEGGENFAIENSIPIEDVIFQIRILHETIERHLSDASSGTLTPRQFDEIKNFQPEF